MIASGLYISATCLNPQGPLPEGGIKCMKSAIIGSFALYIVATSRQLNAGRIMQFHRQISHRLNFDTEFLLAVSSGSVRGALK